MKKKFLLSAILTGLLLCACNDMVDVSYPLPEGNVSSVTISESLLNLKVGASATLNVSVVAEGDVDVVWTNSNQNSIYLVSDGDSATVYALSTGEAFISAIAGALSASCKIVVSKDGGYQPTSQPTSDPTSAPTSGQPTSDPTSGQPTSDPTSAPTSGQPTSDPTSGQPTSQPAGEVTDLELNYSNREIDVQEMVDLVAKVTVSSGPIPQVTWSTQENDIVTLFPNGNSVTVKGISAGTASVIASVAGFSKSCLIKVVEAGTPFVRLGKTSLSLEEGQNETLIVETYPSNAIVSWKSSDTSVATVDNGKVIALKAGTSNISASITVGENVITDVCKVTVKSNAEQEDYAKKISAWSQPGHIYFHYLRNTDDNYSKWALWLWNSYPVDDEGLLYAANPTGYDLKAVEPHTIGWMTNAECGESGNDVYKDEYGQIVDVNLAEDESTLVGGKTGKPVKLISSWEQKELNKNNLGFLIVDQSKMTGDSMWVSDGGAEVYIKKIGKYLENGKDSYLHVYCVEGSVADYKLASGKQEVNNPTLTDETGKYRSNNDVTDLRKDGFKSGVSTSQTFKEDRPGVGYQIFVPSFADSDGDGFGDLQGIIGKLDYLEDLGVDVLWLTPIQESNSYHGYDVTDYYKIDSRFGTLKDYQELLYKAHERGMKVLMDMVINHTSKSNVLYKKSQRADVEVINGKEINYRDMYLWKYKGDKVRVWDEQPATKDSSGKVTANFVTKNVEDVSDWYRDGTSNYYYFGKFGSGMAELNYSSQATRDYMTDMCKYWLSFGLDGFRLDAIKHIYLLAELDPAVNLGSDYITYDVGWKHYYNPEMGKEIDVTNDYSYDRDLNVLFWKQFAGTIKSAYPNCFLVGENFDGWNARMAPFYESMDSQFDFQTYYALNEMKGDSVGSKIKDSLDVYRSYRSNDVMINGAFTSNHDVARMMNHAAAHDDDIASKYSGGDATHAKEITSDSIWNYALKQARYYAGVSLLTPGVSWIYYGDEIGLCGNTQDKVKDSKGEIVDDHGNNLDRWYRQPMRWSNEYGKDNTVKYQFSGMEVLWDNYSAKTQTVPQQLADQNSLLNYFKLLTAAKRNKDYPTYGWVEYACPFGGSEDTTQMMIKDGTRTALVSFNNTDSPKSFSYSSGTVLAGSEGSGATGGGQFTVGARGFLVIKL